MRSLAIAALAALALIAIPPASADEMSALNIEARSLLVDEVSQGQGTPLALLMETTAQDPDPDSVPAFTLQAETLRLETDSSEPGLHSGVVGTHWLVQNVTTTSTPRDLGASFLRLVTSRDNHRVNVYGLEGSKVSANWDCIEVGPTETQNLTREPRAFPRPPMVVGLEKGLQLRPCSASGDLILQGDFVLSAWEADLELTTEGNTTLLETGQLHSQPVPGSPDARPYAGKDQEIYFFAHHAKLTVPMMVGQLYVKGVDLSGGQATLAGAKGTLRLAREVVNLQQSNLELGGALDFAVTSQGPLRPFLVHASGNLESAKVDGRPLSVLVAPAGGQDGFSLLWILVGLVAVLALGSWYLRPWVYYYWRRNRGEPTGSLAPETVWQRQAAGYWALGWNALERQRYRRAHRLADRAASLFPASPDMPLLQGMISWRAGNLEEADRIFSELYMLVPAGLEQAKIACFCAQVAMARRNHEHAFAWLRHAYRNHFMTFRKEAGKPLYDALESDEWFKAMRESAAPAVFRARPPVDQAFS